MHLSVAVNESRKEGSARCECGVNVSIIHVPFLRKADPMILWIVRGLNAWWNNYCIWQGLKLRVVKSISASQELEMAVKNSDLSRYDSNML